MDLRARSATAATLTAVCTEPPVAPASLVVARFASAGAAPAARDGVADALRALAIMAVVASHLCAVTRPRSGSRWYEYLGGLGVACFFVLSGALLTRPFLTAIVAGEALPSTRTFLMRRVRRIVPLYEVALALACVARRIIDGAWPAPADIVAHALLLQTFSERTSQSIDGPLWTMSVDAQFYLALPLVAAVLAALLRPLARAYRPAALFAALAAIVGASLAYRFWQAAAFPRHTVAAAAFVYVDGFIGMASAFALGTALALVAVIRRDRRASPTLGTLALALAAALGVVVARLMTVRPGRVDVADLAVTTTVVLVEAACAALALIGLSAFAPVRRCAGTPPVAIAAALAYGVYLVHYPVLSLAKAALHHPTGPAALATVASFTVVPILALAALLHRTVERPFLRPHSVPRASLDAFGA